MATKLKEQVINKLQEVEDESILEEVLSLLEFRMSKDIIVELSEEQITAIEESRSQIKEGKFQTQEALKGAGKQNQNVS